MPQKTDANSLRRSARNIGEDGKLGNAIVAFLRAPANFAQLVKAAEGGQIPAAIISDPLIAEFGEDTLAPHTIHRFIGTAIRTLLEEVGFETDLIGVRVPRDKLFSTAATFRRRTAEIEPSADSLIKRFVDSLNPQERERALFHLEQKRGQA